MNDLKYFSTFSGIGGFELGIEQACEGKKKGLSASDSLKSTPTPSKCTNSTSVPTTTSETSAKSKRDHYQTLIYWLEAFPARLFRWQESDKDSMTQEAICSLRSLGLLGKNNHACYCLKTSKGFYLTTRGKHSLQSSPRLMSWGTTSNGKCLTAKIMESPKAENECSLSDILEEQPEAKYFRSEAMYQRCLKDVGSLVGATA